MKENNSNSNSLKGEIKFPELVDACPDPILITNTNGETCYVNPAWERMTGYSFKEAKGKNPKFLRSGQTPKRIYRRIWKNLINGKTFYTDEVVDKRKSGSIYQTYSTFFPIKKNGINAFYVQLQHDVTKQKLAEQRRMDFLSMASHELNTPITALRLIAQSLPNKLEAKTIKLSELDILNKELDRLSILVREMLDLTYLETGKMKLQKVKINLTELISEVIVKMQILANKREILFDISDKAEVLADKHSLEQALVNLIMNAIKYSPNWGVILIKLENVGKNVVVSIRDKGTGIPKSKIPRLFEKYYQASSKYQGLGLGLYITKNILLKHKGKIWVESTRGKGSIFYFSLPLVK